ncbi:MAG: hypothetical protein WBA57_04985 [Elainellaceae cyanobacterium]
MAFQLKQIDTISDFDDAIDVLESEYIPELLTAFADSPEGKAYCAAHPEEEEYLGDWIGNFVMFGYAYLEKTLPKMQERDVKEIMLRLFPQKLSLPDPDDADSIVPELIAFWEYMQRQHKQRYSKKILAFLRKIQPTFKDTMTDPSNFGIAKSFLMAGQAAGFDMNSQEEVEAFQQQYNQQLRETGTPPPGFPGLPSPMTAMGTGQNPLAAYPIPEGVPPEFVALLSQQMGLGPMPGLEHLSSNPDDLVEAIARHLVDAGDVSIAEPLDSGDEEESDFLRQLQADEMRHLVAAEGHEISEEAIAQLQQQTITETEPGTIVQDFEALLEAMGDRGLPVSGKLQHLQLKVLGDLNARLSHPIQIDLKRPQQKSYPNLHGLYLLLRTTGIAEITGVGKTLYLTRSAERYESWKALNPTEKYFTLLEAWVIRGDSEVLGDQRSPFSEGSYVLRTWPQLKDRLKTFKDYNAQKDLNYWPGIHNVALMQMFGWIDIHSLKPESGKGWRIKKLNSLPFGDTLVAVLNNAFYQQDFMWESQENIHHPWGEFQPYVQPYFPEWQDNLTVPAAPEHKTGTFMFKVSLGKSWRRLSISSESTLAQLSSLILESVDFDSDHLDMFSYKNAMGRTVEINHPYNNWNGGPYTDEVNVGDLPLEPGMTMTYLFDFGDNWEFDVLCEEFQEGKPKGKSGKILEKHGKAPEQYPNWDEDE